MGNFDSRWNQQEIDILKILWPSSSQDAILAAFPGRTWKAIAHQAYYQGWYRVPGSSKHTPRRSWEEDEDTIARQLYEAGTPISEIATKMNRSETAIIQRAWEKGWRRQTDSGYLQKIEQNPEVSKRVSSGTTIGGRSRNVLGHCMNWE
jgi:hypothetical protein